LPCSFGRSSPRKSFSFCSIAVVPFYYMPLQFSDSSSCFPPELRSIYVGST
jgi:hypothetical protein